MFGSLIQQVAPLGPGAVVATLVFVIVAAAVRGHYRARLAAIQRARTADIPRVVGDEIDKLGISANNLSTEHQFVLVKHALEQRESRSRRLMILALAVLAVPVVLVISGFVPVGPSGGGSMSRCRVPVPETRQVDPPRGNTFAMLRARKTVLAKENEQEVPRGTFVTIQSAEIGDDGECWYRVRVRGTEAVGWIHSISFP